MLMDYYVGEQLRRAREAEWAVRESRGEFVTDDQAERLPWRERLRAYTNRVKRGQALGGQDRNH